MVVTAADLRALEADQLRARTARDKAETTKFRAESAFLRRQDTLLEKEEIDTQASLYEQRIYEFSGEVNEDSVGEAITVLSEWRYRSKDPIMLRLWSEGGSIIDGLALFDFVVALRSEGIKVDTVVLGWAASMAGVLMQCGTKRYIGHSAHVLIHEGRTWVPEERLTNLKDAVKFMQMLEVRCMDILAERSTMTAAQMSKKMGAHDWWITADEAIAIGLADDYWPLTTHRRRKK